MYSITQPTPLQFVPKLTNSLGNNLWLKREDLHAVFSFKIRGAFNCIANLKPDQRARGIICASAGNHAQGVALSAKELNINATIVMPETTPQIKIDAVVASGADVVLSGISYSDAAEKAAQLTAKKGLSYIHPFDDPYVIAGQGTIGKEILSQFADFKNISAPIDAIFICVGGGGLLAGIAAYVKQIQPNIKIIGVEPEDSDAMTQSLAAGQVVELDDVGIFADGVAVKKVGDETFRLSQQFVDEMVTVSTDQICAAIKDVFNDTRTVLEPAGAVGLAGAKKLIQERGWLDKNIVVTASGANMNFDRLRHVSERTQFAERREGILAVKIPEVPGSFKRFCRELSHLNITEFNYRHADSKQALVYVGVEIKSAAHLTALIEQLSNADYETVDLTDNELAKLHIRHLLGGRTQEINHERLFRFRFPERPGALLAFLESLGTDWNISLFHYRNHGTDFGRVLCGLQAIAKEFHHLDELLTNQPYWYEEETDNPAYQLFLT